MSTPPRSSPYDASTHACAHILIRLLCFCVFPAPTSVPFACAAALQVRRTRRPNTTPPRPLTNGHAHVHHPTSNGVGHYENGHDVHHHQDQNGVANHRNGMKEEFACPDSGCNDLYSATGVSALLCRDAPNCMADFLKLVECNYSYFAFLSEVRRC